MRLNVFRTRQLSSTNNTHFGITRNPDMTEARDRSPVENRLHRLDRIGQELIVRLAGPVRRTSARRDGPEEGGRFRKFVVDQELNEVKLRSQTVADASALDLDRFRFCLLAAALFICNQSYSHVNSAKTTFQYW
jgi:hypothetical protein